MICGHLVMEGSIFLGSWYNNVKNNGELDGDNDLPLFPGGAVESEMQT